MAFKAKVVHTFQTHDTQARKKPLKQVCLERDQEGQQTKLRKTA